MRARLGTEVLGAGTGCIGTSDDLQNTLCTFAEAEVDQTIFIQQAGKNEHGAICELLALLPPAAAHTTAHPSAAAPER